MYKKITYNDFNCLFCFFLYLIKLLQNYLFLYFFLNELFVYYKTKKEETKKS